MTKTVESQIEIIVLKWDQWGHNTHSEDNGREGEGS